MSDSPKKLFLLDAMALVYRAYFAFSTNHRVNSKGLNTSAMFGFTNTLLEVLKKENPTHIAVIFDTSAPTHRHEAFEDYKAHREAMPEDLSKSIPYIKQIIRAFNIPSIELDGYEADDIIGTFSKRAEAAGFTTYMMTPDKDYMQLVTEKVLMYKPARNGNGAEVLGVKEVCERYGIERPEQVIDILGLMGDTSDNIPGIPGVGEKTAIQLVKDFGSIDNLLANTSQLKGKLKEKVEMNTDKAIMSRQLATIHCDVPVEFNEKELELEEPNKDALREIFQELEFRRMAQIILGEDLPVAVAEKDSKGQMDMFGTATIETIIITESSDESEVVYNNISNVLHNYEIVNTAEKRASLIQELLASNEVSFDTETTGLDANQVELVGLSFSIKEHEGWYVPIPENYDDALAIVQEFKPVYEHPTILKIGQNIKYDMNVLKWYNIEVQTPIFDTMVAHYLIQPEMRHNMNVLAEAYLKYSPVSIETLIGKKGKDQLSMRSVDENVISEYAAEDADITLQLKEKFQPMLKETLTEKLFHEVEIPLIPVLGAMEREGIKLDMPVLAEFSKILEQDILAIDKEIQALAGTPFNISSPKQVGDILFEVLKIDEKPKKTKTGQYATSEDILSKLAGKHPIIDKILDYREIVKLKSTYVDALPQLVNPRTGRLHTTYNQVVAVTGRLSSDNPNLQNIPIRTERGREVRKAFIPRNDDFVLLSADYSQIELRIMADLCKDPGMLEAFNNHQDIHASTAAKVFGVADDEVTSDMRRKAKMVNFGIIYGISAFGLSERLNIPRKEAAGIIEQYFMKYPLIKDFMDSSIEKARSQGYVETILGRRRYLRDINSNNATVRGFAERNAINAPIQGSAADMIKIAMINLHRIFNERKFKSRMLLQVHDELVFDVHKDELDEIKPLVVEQMRIALPLSVPVDVEAGTGLNWLEAH
jgi:DNA polymerase-1